MFDKSDRDDKNNFLEEFLFVKNFQVQGCPNKKIISDRFSELLVHHLSLF